MSKECPLFGSDLLIFTDLQLIKMGVLKEQQQSVAIFKWDIETKNKKLVLRGVKSVYTQSLFQP